MLEQGDPKEVGGSHSNPLEETGQAGWGVLSKASEKVIVIENREEPAQLQWVKRETEGNEVPKTALV